jgi:hypothetical protein
MSVVQPIAAPSSTPVIQGEHAWIGFAQMIAESLPKQLLSLEKEVEKELNKRLRTELSTDSQWASLVGQVNLTVEDGTITLEALSHAVSDLEYGTPEIPMNSKLRPFIRTAHEYLRDEIDKVVSAYS